MNGHILVEASAGSGKTQCLTDRLVSGIQRGLYDPARVAAMTFTRKAAAELSTRLRLALDGRFEVFVSTTHGFCSHILRSFPLQAGLTPDFREVEDDRLWRHCLKQEWEQPGGLPLLLQLAEVELSPTDLLPALKTMDENGEIDYPSDPFPLPDPAEVWPVVECLQGYLPQMLPSSAPGCPLFAAARRLCHARPNLAELVQALTPWESQPKPIRRLWRGYPLAEVCQAAQFFRHEVVKPFLRRWRAHLYSQCVPFLMRVRKRCQEERRRLGLVSFHDLLRKCRQLLLEHPDVLRTVQARYAHLLVDEFQDTDPLQAEILWLIAGPLPAGLFLVGDPKQSIYRFRRADHEVYQEMRRRILVAGGEVVSLTHSYRSRPRLCDWLNVVFSRLLPRGFQPLRSELSDSDEPAVWKLRAERRDEPQRIAAYINNRVAAGTHRYGDFLILTARRAELRLYQRSLEALRIPCEAPVEEGPLGLRAASLLPLLRHLADPQDKAILVGVLRGPLFGHSDEDLFLHVQAAGSLRPYSPGSGLAAVQASLEKLNEWRIAVRWLPPGAALAFLIEKTGLLALAAAEGPASLAQLRGMLDSMRTSGEAGLTLAQAVSRLTERGSVELPSSRYAQRNAVRILNVHKAKGLEARVVFLAAPWADFTSRVDHAVDGSRRGYLRLRQHRRVVAEPADWPDHEARERMVLREERRRFLYVAATRARETIIVSGGGRGPWRALEPFLQGCPEVPVENPLKRSQPAPAYPPRPRPRPSSWERATVAWRKGRCAPAQDWGKLVHAVFEHSLRDPQCDLSRVARWLCPDLIDRLPEALEMLSRARNSRLGEWMSSAQELLVEIPFGIRQGSRTLFGTIDLALRRQDGWGIVDFKTDQQPMAKLVSQYSRQLERYAVAWRRLASEPLQYAGIFGVREGRLGPNLTL